MKKTISLLVLTLFSAHLAFAWPSGSGFKDAIDAKNVRVSTANFSKNLSSTDINAQHALETLDQMSAGSGSVTSVSVATANGFSGSVANPTTTPAITLTAGAITPTSVNSVVLSGSSTPTLAVTGTTTVSGANTGDQTTVSGNAGTATTLATTRAIYGNNFDGSAALTQIIASTYGGTGNGFTKFSGAASSEKTFTLPNASANILTDNALVTVPQGGIGIGTLTAYSPVFGGTTSTAAVQSGTAGTAGQVLKSGGASAVGAYADDIGVVGIAIDGAGSAITTGVKGYVYCPFAGTISSATLIGDQTGSIVIDVWKLAFSTSALPTVSNTITASALPTISSAKAATDSTLTGWTTSVSAGDVFGFNVNSCTTTTKANLILKIKKS